MVLARELLDAGVFVNPVVAPAVPRGLGLIRLSLMLDHTPALLEEAAEAIYKVLNDDDQLPEESSTAYSGSAARPRAAAGRPCHPDRGEVLVEGLVLRLHLAEARVEVLLLHGEHRLEQRAVDEGTVCIIVFSFLAFRYSLLAR